MDFLPFFSGSIIGSIVSVLDSVTGAATSFPLAIPSPAGKSLVSTTGAGSTTGVAGSADSTGTVGSTTGSAVSVGTVDSTTGSTADCSLFNSTFSFFSSIIILLYSIYIII